MASKISLFNPHGRLRLGDVKDQVYFAKVTSVQDLKESIVYSVEGIPPEMCVNAFWAFENGMDIALATEGAPVEVILGFSLSFSHV
jgi:hypothetical protein